MAKERFLGKGAGVSTKRVPHDANSPVDCSPKQDCLSDWTPPRPFPPDGAPAAPAIVFLAPQGRRFDDAYASELAQRDHLLFVCGHYEGIDERVYTLADEVISLGDYVLTSGELASMVVIDAVVRKIPGVLGAEDGPVDESFTSGLLEYPQYTRPATFRGMEVPPVLLSGNHAAVDAWRRETSLERTARLRPDLLEAFERAGNLTPADRKFLKSLAAEQV
ncbi:MAG: tRNA (guanosine(37)-N1)-methyltransferase TrmD [Eggerthellaceae bacterium]|nr:tRNA (guanosine(37)-N1)-methyltransferase TrmD [Eggerthellaceae bacterium]